MTKVSIIIPCYNRPETLRNTLEKCWQQTLQDIEIICVDDGSTDETPEMIESFRQADPRIRLLRLASNGGPGLARNAGLKIAVGEYVAFLDSDDWPEHNDFYERLYEAAHRENAPIAKGEYKFLVYKETDSDFNRFLKINKNCFCKNYCAAIYKRTFLEKGDIRFPALRVLEDPIFSVKAAILANKLLLVPGARLCISQNSAEDRSSTPEGAKALAKGLLHYVKTLNSLSLTPDEYAWNVATHLKPFIQNALLSGLDCLEVEALAGLRDLWPLLKEKEKLTDLLPLDEEELDLLVNKAFPVIGRGKQIRLKILKAKVVSFDIFDTFILRPFLWPDCLFHYMQTFPDAKGFYSERVSAEKSARLLNNTSEEITFQEIYELMPPRFQKFRELELGLEETLTFPNPEILELYRLAKKMGKKVVFTSDMYLPLESIRKILVRCGAHPEDEIFLSSELGKTKSMGELFDTLIEKTGVSPKDILHVGDNWNSDTRIAHSKGLESIHYFSPRGRYWESFALLPYRKQYRWFSPHYLHFEGLNFLRWFRGEKKKSPLYSFFYQYAAPLVITLCQNIHAIGTARKLDDIILSARDGYLIKKVYDILFSEEKDKVHYVYLNRDIKKKYYDANPHDPDNEFSKYIETINFHGTRTGIFDSIAINFSSQQLLEKYLFRKTLGIYITCQPSLELEHINLSNSSPTYLWRSFGWSICEFFLSSAESEILDIKDGQPVYDEVDGPQQRRMEIFADLEAAVLDAAQLFAEVFAGSVSCPSLNEYCKMLHQLMKDPGRLTETLHSLEVFDEGSWKNVLDSLPENPIEMV